MQCLHLFINTNEDLSKLTGGFHAIYTEYVICSAETYNLIPCCNLQEQTKGIGRLGIYSGSKVLIDDTLPFGEVRLR